MKWVLSCVIVGILTSAIGFSDDRKEEKPTNKGCREDGEVCFSTPFYCLEYCIFEQANYHLWVAVKHTIVFCTEYEQEYAQKSTPHTSPIPQDCEDKTCDGQEDYSFAADAAIELVSHEKTFYDTLPANPETYGPLKWNMKDAVEVQSEQIIKLTNVNGASIYFKLYVVMLDANKPLRAAAIAQGIPVNWLKKFPPRLARVGFQITDPGSVTFDDTIPYDSKAHKSDDYTLKLTPKTYKQPFFVKTLTKLP